MDWDCHSIYFFTFSQYNNKTIQWRKLKGVYHDNRLYRFKKKKKEISLLQYHQPFRGFRIQRNLSNRILLSFFIIIILHMASFSIKIIISSLTDKLYSTMVPAAQWSRREHAHKNNQVCEEGGENVPDKGGRWREIHPSIHTPPWHEYKIPYSII